MNNEQTITLLRKNKRKQVEALNACGFGLEADMKASLMPMYIKWAQGLLDVTVAVYRISDGSKMYFTVAEWEALTATQQRGYLKRGVRIRAYGIQFILGMESASLAASGSQIAGQMLQISESSDYPQMFRDEDARGATEKLAASMEGVTANSITGSPAAEYALGYKACTEADGVEDTTEWGIPMPCHGRIFYRFFAEINEVINRVWSNSYALTNEVHLLCVQNSSSTMWSINVAGGYFNSVSKTTATRIRLVGKC